MIAAFVSADPLAPSRRMRMRFYRDVLGETRTQRVRFEGVVPVYVRDTYTQGQGRRVRWPVVDDTHFDVSIEDHSSAVTGRVATAELDVG